MLDPFKTCPFYVLGLLPCATTDEITRRWRTLMKEHHPDKTHDTDVSNLRAQVYNDAKERALSKHDGFPYKIARMGLSLLNAEQMRQMEEDALRTGKLFETMWSEPDRIARMQAANDKAEQDRVQALRVENDRQEAERMEKIRAENDAAENARLQSIREHHDALSSSQHTPNPADLKRKHVKVWHGKEVQETTKRIHDFVDNHVVLDSTSAITCRDMLLAFKTKYPADVSVQNMFFRTFSQRMKARYANQDFATGTFRGQRAYKGISLRSD
jgi:hypothetical protein